VLQGAVRTRIGRGGDAATVAHLRDVDARIQKALSVQ
jgi:hypothetical protein